ncbi:MAG: hypothetical protein QF733_06820 [Phycisphaerales bacterium]|jgi:hypothetical protein|nr:hypothetical protein [Phycisphaerales bacterium]
MQYTSRSFTALGCLLSLVLTGCQLDYDVTMTISGDVLHRDVAVSSDIEDVELDAIRHAMGPHYAPRSRRGSDPGLTPPRYLFASDVSGAGWPDGFGGQGLWTTHASPLGTASCFMECLGGDVTAVDDVLALQKGIDAIVNRIRRHLRTELADDPLLPDMLRLLNDRIHSDAADAAMLGWALVFSSQMLPGEDVTGGGPGDDRLKSYFQERLLSAALAFLWQRGWLTADEATMAALDPDSIEAGLPRIAARALGLRMTGDWNAQVRALGSRLEDSFPEGFSDELQATFTAAIGSRPRLAAAWAATSSILTSHEVTVQLKASSRPASTNGIWSQERGVVEWSLDTPPLAVGLTAPPLCWTASWAHPDEAAQQRILGHVCIDGTQLVEFATRWSMATPSQQDEVRDTLESFAAARSGTPLKAEADHVLSECMHTLAP